MGKDYKGGILKGVIAFKPCDVKVLRVCVNLCSQISRFLGLHVSK